MPTIKATTLLLSLIQCHIPFVMVQAAGSAFISPLIKTSPSFASKRERECNYGSNYNINLIAKNRKKFATQTEDPEVPPSSTTKFESDSIPDKQQNEGGVQSEQESNAQRSRRVLHHVAIKTRNITTAIDFYSLLDYDVDRKFRAGSTKAAWLEHKYDSTSRIELIEVPSYMLNEPEGMKRRAINLAERQELLGMNHLAIDVTEELKIWKKQATSSNNDTAKNKDDNDTVVEYDLAYWIENLNKKSKEKFGKTLLIALPPEQRMIGRTVFELAFLYDADGALIEILREIKDLQQDFITDGWEPLKINLDLSID